MPDLKERVDTLEAVLGSFIVQTEKAIKAVEEQSKEFRKDINKKWGELSNKLGSIAEDIAAPGVSGIMKKYFEIEPDKRMDTLIVRNVKNKEQVREFDVVALADDLFMLCEIKATPWDQYVNDFINLIKSGEVYDYFSEYKDKKLIPVFSSLSLPAHIVKKLTKNHILAMAMADEHMDIVNPTVLDKYKK